MCLTYELGEIFFFWECIHLRWLLAIEEME